MSALQALRKRLKSAGRQRLWLGWMTAGLWLSMEVEALLLLLFAVDFGLRLPPAPRLVSLFATAAFLLWRIYVRTRPWWRWPEGAVDIALLLGKRQPSADGVVAALQFEQSDLSRLGSRELTEQVTREAVACESELDFHSLIPVAEYHRLAWRAAGVFGLFLTIAVLFHDYSQVFAARLLLTDAAYPTRTRIIWVGINDRPIRNFPPVARVVEGSPLAFAVRAGGVLPASGTVRVESATGDDVTVLTMTPSASSGDDEPRTYRTAGPKLKEPATVSFALGDAQFDQIRIELVRRPIIELSIDATPPKYAQQKLAAESSQDRYVSVLSGSAVGFRLRCTNGKQLRSVDLEWSTESASGTASLSRPESPGDVWRTTAETAPWLSLTETLRFAVNVVDEDGLSMLEPLRGRIDVRPDQSPVGSLRTEHHLVVATAQPILRYEASDDFGVLQLIFQVSRQRDGDESFENKTELRVTGTGQPPDSTRVEGEFPVDLRGLDLRTGDRVLVRLSVDDQLGQGPRYRFTSEPVEIEIADEARVLKAILQADATAERLLTDAIEAESMVRDKE